MRDLHFAPGVIDGPHTSDCQAHHDWEDTQRLACDGWGRIDTGLKVVIVCVIVLAGFTLGTLLGNRLIALITGA